MSQTSSVRSLSDESAALTPRRSWLLRQSGTALLIELALLIALVAVATRSVAGFVMAALALVLLAILLLPIQGRPLWRLAACRREFAARRPRPPRQRAGSNAALEPLYMWRPGLKISSAEDGAAVVSDGTGWSGMLALESNFAQLGEEGDQLNLNALARLTVHDDVVFSAIQLVTFTVAAPNAVLLGEKSGLAQAYREVSEQGPPPAVQLTWLSIRLDPAQCLAAIERRGGGLEAITGALAFGVSRVQAELRRQGVPTRHLTAREAEEALALTCGAGPDRARPRSVESWEQWDCDSLVHQGAAVSSWGASPTRGYARLLAAAELAPALYALTSYQVAPNGHTSGGFRVAAPSSAAAGLAARAVAQEVRGALTLHPAQGRQVPVMLGTIPLGLTA